MSSNSGRVFLGVGLLGAAGYGLLQLLPKTFDLNAAKALALNWGTALVNNYQQAGFSVTLQGVEDARAWWGPPPSIPFAEWQTIQGFLAGRVEDLFYVQIGVQWLSAPVGPQNWILVMEKARAPIVYVLNTLEELASWFRPLGP